MKILLGHTFPEKAAFGSSWIEDWLYRLRCAGFEVYPFSLVVNQLRPVIYFDELDILWRYKDQKLLSMYEQLSKELLDYDAFICFNGANIHPEFVANLDCITVYGCFDDPESSEKLSKPVATAFDLAMVGNIAELDTYRSWGVKNIHWWPLGFRYDDYDSSLTEQNILEAKRNVDVTLLCERTTRYRKKRVEQFVSAFPNGAYFGRGWPSGFLPEEQRIPLLQQSRIGINIHNSTGPINFRTFYLPANGVMQICDNKSYFGKIFELGVEAVGYDSIDEAIELTRYYIEHDADRRRIAVAGWKRTLTDYNEVSCFQIVVDAINGLKCNIKEKASCKNDVILLQNEGSLRRFINKFILFVWVTFNTLRLKVRAVIRKFLSKIIS